MEFLTNSDQLEFLQRQISVKKPSNDWSPLLYASYFGHTKIVKHILQILNHFRTIWEDDFEKYDVLEDNVLGTDNGLKAFHLAIIRGHTEVMKVLLDFDEGMTRTLVHANLELEGIELAVVKGHLEAVKFLKQLLRNWEKNGLDIDKPFDGLDIEFLKSAAYISKTKIEIARYLLSSKF